MKKLLTMFLMLLGSVFAFLACSSEKSASNSNVSSDVVTVDVLNGNTYLLSNMFDDSDIFITFDGEQFSGKSVINNFFGSYKIEDGNKFVSNDADVSTGMTMMAGAPDDMENDNAFFTLFSDIDTVSLDGNTLTFTTTGGDVLIFVESDSAASIDAMAFPETEGQPVGDLGLANNILAFIGQEFVLSNMFEGNDITFVFVEDGKIGGKAAVNNYMGTYTVGDANAFAIAETMGTTRMSGEPSAMQAEAAYLALLPTVVTLDMVDGKIILTTSDATELIFE